MVFRDVATVVTRFRRDNERERRANERWCGWAGPLIYKHQWGGVGAAHESKLSSGVREKAFSV